MRRSLVFLIACGSPGAAAAEVRVEPQPSHELRLTLHYFSGTRWSPQQIATAAVEAGRLLRQCGIRLSQAEPVALEVPRRFHFYLTPVSRELLRRLNPSKPAVFFVEDTYNRPAYDAEAVGRGNSGARPELADTVWIAHGARDLPQVIAHELMHVLSDSGEHSEEPENLMSTETSPRSTRLSAEQCERARSRGTQNGLLRKSTP